MALRDKFFSDNIKIGNMPCIAFLNFGICPGSLSKEGFEILLHKEMYGGNDSYILGKRCGIVNKT